MCSCFSGYNYNQSWNGEHNNYKYKSQAKLCGFLDEGTSLLNIKEKQKWTKTKKCDYFTEALSHYSYSLYLVLLFVSFSCQNDTIVRFYFEGQPICLSYCGELDSADWSLVCKKMTRCALQNTALIGCQSHVTTTINNVQPGDKTTPPVPLKEDFYREHLENTVYHYSLMHFVLIRTLILRFISFQAKWLLTSIKSLFATNKSWNRERNLI